MLRELARKSPPENLRLVPGAMQDFDLGSQRFSLVFSAFRSFQHPLTVEDQLSCLAAVRRHLAPGGLFAFGGDSGYRENGQLKSSGSAVIPRSPSTSYVIPSEARDLPS